MTTPEGKIKDAIKKILAKHCTYWHCPVQNGMGAPSLDFICCHKGYYIAIEAKAPGKKPTVRQLQTIKQISISGGLALVIDGPEGLAVLDTILSARKTTNDSP